LKTKYRIENKIEASKKKRKIPISSTIFGVQ
jgi:hypothetical protein